MTFTAILPDFGFSNGRDVSLCSVSHASGSTSAFSVVLSALSGSFAPRKQAGGQPARVLAGEASRSSARNVIDAGDERRAAGAVRVSPFPERPLHGRYHIWYDAAMAWTVETLNETVDAELAELPADMRARLARISELIGAVGLPNVKEPHVRHVRGQLWEIRLKGKAGIARALYVTANEQRVVILRAFIKKTEKTPAGEIDLALQRGKEFKP